MSMIWPKTELRIATKERKAVEDKIKPLFSDLLKSLNLDSNLSKYLKTVYIPLAAWIMDRAQYKNHPLVVGINGAQGSGKSTLARILEKIFIYGFEVNVANFSIDDIYKTRKEREWLARNVHPLLITRGVPGTHDVELGLKLLSELRRSGPKDTISIPRFNKAIDDRYPESQWPHFRGPAHLILFEGWCVGAKAQNLSELEHPINDLEIQEDLPGKWRRYVNEQLANVYAKLFAQIDLLIMIKVPGMDSIFEWRRLQEEKLAKNLTKSCPVGKLEGKSRIMDSNQLQRFIMHYERLTRYMLKEMPNRANVILSLDRQHQICNIELNPIP